jgi:ribonuclease BN (tRNA processing enzyme)
MSKRGLDIAYFLSFCIEQYKEAKHLSGAEAARIFSQYGVLEYLEEHFEPLHSQSRQWVLEDIEEFIKLRKGEAA